MTKYLNMTKKIILTVGISGSGKSTFAKEEWNKNPLTTVVINRDSIRNLLFGFTDETISEYYKRSDLGKLEKQVTKYEDTLINEALCENKTVIVDATHLEKSYLKRFEFWNVLIEYKYFEVSVETAILRDSKRIRSVGVEVIKKQYEKFLNMQREGVPLVDSKPVEFKQDKNLPPCMLLDLDGTVAHMTNRTAFQWSRVGEDYVDTTIKAISNAIYFNHTANIIVCTGRDGVCLEESLNWLRDHNISFDKIYIRKQGDQRPDWVIKEELWRQISKDYYIMGLIDDRNQVVRRARALGLKVLQVEYGNF